MGMVRVGLARYPCRTTGIPLRREVGGGCTIAKDQPRCPSSL